MPGNSLLPGGGKGLGSPAPTPAVGDPGGTVRVLKMEKARIRVPGQGDQIAIGGMVYFDKATTDLVPGQSGSIQKIAEELAGKPQQVEIVATASNQPLPRGLLVPRPLGTRLCPLPPDGRALYLVEDRARTVAVVRPAGQRAGEQGDAFSEADVAVRVYLSATLPAGKLGLRDREMTREADRRRGQARSLRVEGSVRREGRYTGPTA